MSHMDWIQPQIDKVTDEEICNLEQNLHPPNQMVTLVNETPINIELKKFYVLIQKTKNAINVIDKEIEETKPLLFGSDAEEDLRFMIQETQERLDIIIELFLKILKEFLEIEISQKNIVICSGWLVAIRTWVPPPPPSWKVYSTRNPRPKQEKGKEVVYTD